MTQTFSLGAINKSAPTLPAPLDHTVFNTRQQIRDHQNAVADYHNYQRNIAHQIKVAADNARAKELAEAQREMTDLEYDAVGLKRFNDAKDKAAALVAKEKSDALEKIAFRMSTPSTVNLQHRSEYSFLKDFEYWCELGYTLGENGLNMFQPGFYNVDLTAPAAAKKAGK